MDGLYKVEKVTLLGLVTILGATTTVPNAVAAIGVSLGAGLVVALGALIMGRMKNVPAMTWWMVLITLGFGTSWVLTGAAITFLPLRSSAVMFLRLAGVSPIIFIGWHRAQEDGQEPVDQISRSEAFSLWGMYLITLLKFGVIREILGSGTFWGNLITPTFTTPADFFAGPIGAFLLLGAGALGVRLVARWKPSLEGLL